MKLKLHIKEIAERRGIKNARQLALKSGLNFTSAYNLWNGTAQGIHFDNLQSLCDLLQADPGLLIEYHPKPRVDDAIHDEVLPGADRKAARPGDGKRRPKLQPGKN